MFKSILIPQFSRYGRLVREGGWIVFGQIASVLGALMLVRVLSSYLNPTQYGQLALGLTVAGLVNQVIMGGVTNGITRYYSVAAEKQDLVGYLYASGRMMTYATLAVFAIGLALIGGLYFFKYSQWLGFAVAVLVLSLLNGYNSSLSGIQNAARQRSVVAFHRGLDAWLKILFAVGVILWLGSSSTAVVIGYVLSSILVTGSQCFFLQRVIHRDSLSNRDHTPWVKQMWAYSWPFSVWGIFSWLQQSSDRWALDVFASTHEVGFYAVLFQLGYTPIALVTGIIITFLGPILFQISGDASDHSRNTNVHRLAWRITMFCLLVTITGFLFALGLHKLIFRLLVATEYRIVSYLLPWVVLAGGLFAAGQMLSLKLMSEIKSSRMIWAKIVTALLGVLFNIYGASVAGLNGIVGALVAFSIIYLVWMAWLAFRTPT